MSRIPVLALTLFASLAGLARPLAGAEPTLVSLKEFVSTEVRQQGFTLTSPGKVHVYARGAGGTRSALVIGSGHLTAYGWLLNATTREVVWEMTPANSTRKGEYQIADTYLDLPAGSYEAYFANHGYARHTLFTHIDRNIDRRNLRTEERRRPRLLGMDRASLEQAWREQAGQVGMEVYGAGGGALGAQTFQAPLRWRNIAISLCPVGDRARLTQAFRCRKPVRLHIYAEGEGNERSRLHDYGWILDLQTRKPVWEMLPEKAQYAGGASKNRRQVETVDLPPGDYEAVYVTDDSHSPADWNSAPPCDPGFYGLTLSLPREEDKAAFSLMESPQRPQALAQLAPMGSGEDRRAAFQLAAPQTVRIVALGEWDDDWADEGWIEEAGTGKKVWTMKHSASRHAGGAAKNRSVDEVVQLPKGSYVLRYVSDGSHAHGGWNADPPREPEAWGIAVYPAGR